MEIQVKKKKPSIRKLNKNLIANKTVFKPKAKLIKYNKYKPNRSKDKTKVYEPARNSLKKVYTHPSVVGKVTKTRSFKYTGHWSDIKIFLLEAKFFLQKLRILERLNFVIALLMSISVGSFLSYLIFFDTYFLVKDYQVFFDNHCFEDTTLSYSDCSYLSHKNTAKVLDIVKKSKFLGFVPNNQLWFLNDRNYTFAARKSDFEIINIEIVKRYWPNKAVLKITTKPILLTLQINDNQYWRVSQDGIVLGLDEAGLKERLVKVDSKIEFNTVEGSFEGYTFADNLDQKNRFWFIIWLWQNLQQNGIEIQETKIPSLVDQDVIIQTKSGTKLWFDPLAMTQQNQQKRLNASLNKDSLLRKNMLAGKYKYLDYRFPRKIFICEKGQSC